MNAEFLDIPIRMYTVEQHPLSLYYPAEQVFHSLPPPPPPFLRQQLTTQEPHGSR